ncbi:MAG: hypothetical protein PF443_00215, partial [Allgaiera sp.]|nr:hypothetical protein [Allgaiera sp.]
MTNRIVEGFATYGLGDLVTKLGAPTSVGESLLSGVWAELALNNILTMTLGTLPWDPQDTDVYYGCAEGAAGYQSGVVFTTDVGIRRVLPATYTNVIMSFYYAMKQLTASETCILAMHDNANAPIFFLTVTSTGVLRLYASNGTTMLGATSGPVVVAETAAHFEFQVDNATGAFTLNVNGTAVMSYTGLTFGNTNALAQIRLLPRQGDAVNMRYISNLIVRDTAGTVNNSITGDRRVATLLVHDDDTANQGWTARSQRRFNAGVLNMPNTEDQLYTWSSGTGLLGAGDYTFEGQFRSQAALTGSDFRTLAGLWD